MKGKATPEQKVKMAQLRLLKKIKKEIYRRELKPSPIISLRSHNDARIRAVALYALEGMLSDFNREIEDAYLKSK